jgi:alpha-L-fucosidase
VARGTTIGNRRILPFDTITTDRLRITFEAKACPLISNLEVYKTPDRESPLQLMLPMR